MSYAAYLHLDGILGDCAEEAHRGWLTVDSFSHSVSNPQQGRGAFLGDLSIARMVDRATPLLARATAEGRVYREARLELCRTDGSRARYMELRLSNARLTMHSLSGSPQADVGTPFESLNLACEKIEWLYFPSAFEPTPEAASEVRAGWSVQTALATA